MRFFAKLRPEVYIHGARLRRDKKTGKRLWGLVFIITLNEELVKGCGPLFERAWQYIGDLDNGTIEMLFVGFVEGCEVDFFARIDDVDSVLHLEGVEIGEFRMTRDGNVVEFWFRAEHENTSGLHSFVKEYAFTRCWAQFRPRQADLQMEQAKSS